MKMRDFAKAKEKHESMKEAAEALRQAGVTDEGEEVWRSIIGDFVKTPPAQGSLAWHVDIEMPIDIVPTVRAHSEIAAAYAYCCMVGAMLKHPNDPKMAAELGWKAVLERRAMANKLEEGYGCDKSPSWELARELSGARDASAVEAIAKMAGQMFHAMSGLRKAPTFDPQEVEGVEQGGEPERLLAQELVQLVDPALEDQAAIKILEKRAAQYKMRGERSANRGPLVIALDESGSMHDDGEGDRNTWAKAAAVALARVAHDGGRMVSVVHFASSTATTRCAPGDHQALLNMSRHFLSGGTSIALALTVAADEVEQLRLEGHVGADIVIVTDGEDRNNQGIDKVLALTQAKGTRLWTVAVECSIPNTSPLVRRASHVVRVGATKRADLVAGLKQAAMQNTPSTAGVGGMLN